MQSIRLMIVWSGALVVMGGVVCTFIMLPMADPALNLGWQFRAVGPAMILGGVAMLILALRSKPGPREFSIAGHAVSLPDLDSKQLSLSSRRVVVPSGHTIVFPDRCVECGAPGPGGRVTLSTANVINGSHEWFWNWTPARWVWPFGRVYLTVPICPGCQPHLRRRGRWRFALFTADLMWCLIALVLGVVHYDDWGLAKSSRRTVALLILGVPMVIPFVLEFWLSQPFSFWADKLLGCMIDFRDPACAEEFYRLNGGRDKN